MDKNRKTSHILNIFQYDEVTGAVTLPSTLTIAAPSSSDNSTKVITSAWARTYVTGLNYLTAGSTTTSDIGEGTNLYFTTTRVNDAFDTRLALKTTSDLTEGTNLYYTASRFDTRFGTKTTTDLTEGTNLYYTQARFNTAFGGKSTTDLTEGTNLYYTAARFNTAFSGKSTTDLSEGTNLYYTDGRVGTYLTNNSYATQSYVGTQIANLVSTAPATLDTLAELATALGSDPNFATTVSTSIGTKVPQTRTITINGTSYDLTANRTWTIPSSIATATDSAVSGPTSGQLLRYNGTAWANWTPNYLTSFTESDPIYTASTWYTTTNNATNWNTAYGWGNHASIGYLTGITSLQVTTALGYTPYNSTNPNSYISGITSLMVTNALGYTPYNSSNPNGYISSYTETDTLASVTSRGNTTTSILYVYPNLSAEPYVSAHFYNTNSSTTRYGGILVSGIEQAHLRLMYGSNDWSSASAKKWQIRVRMDNSQDLFKIFNWQSSKDVWSINSSAEEFLAAEDNGTATSRRYYNYASNEHRFYAVNAAGATTAVKLMEYDGGSYQRVLTTGNYSTYALPLSGGTMSGTPVFTAAWSNAAGDYTGITNPAYKVDVTSGYWRVVYKGAHASVSGVYNYETGKNVYWGEPTDTGDYIFRGRTMKWAASNGTEYTVWNSSNLTNLNQLTNGPGYLTSVAWTGISSGIRENYNLGFRPADNSSSYAGFSFGSPGNDANAGYFLVRGGADNDVYTQNGLTIVADLGWLTLAQRTTASKGVRIMTGSSTSSTRISVTDSYSTFSNNIKFAGSTNNAYLGSSDWGFRVTNDNGYIQFGPANNSWSHIYSDKSFYFNQALYVNGTQVVTNSGTWSINVSGSAGSASSANYAGYLPTLYAGGQQTNPQVYFNNGIGLRAAMTGSWSVWSDTLWVNGYSGGDVKWMCALHFLRNSEPRMAISAQQHDGTAYGSYYEVLSTYNAGYAYNMDQNVRSGDSPSFHSPSVYYLRNRYDVSIDHPFGLYFNTSTSDYSYAIYRQTGAWSHPYPDLHIAFHTGIKLGAHYSYQGIRFYNNSDFATITASVGDGDNNMRGYYDIIAYASDRRLKHNIQPIENALDKVNSLTGMTYQWNNLGSQYGWDPDTQTREVGVFAQDVQAVLPEATKLAPFDNNMGVSKSGENFLTVKYEKIVPLLIEAIKEQQGQIEDLKKQINYLVENK